MESTFRKRRHLSYQTHLYEYEHEGATWTIEVRASSADDARERMAKLREARYLGVLQMKIPVELGIFARLICRFKNRRNND